MGVLEKFSPKETEPEKISMKSTTLAQILLLAIPLISAPVAFYFNSQRAENYSLGLEFLVIGILFLEFLIIVMINSRFLKYDGIYKKTKNERFEVFVECSNCKEGMRFSILSEVAQKIECYECGNSQRISLNQNQDGITHIETSSP